MDAVFQDEEGAPLLLALTDVRTEDEYDQRQEQRERAAKAEEQRCEQAEERELAAEWAQAEWFETREHRMEDVAGLWDEAGAEDNQ
ncbi:hypothetical protein SAMN05216223_11644 [Actinacidiphila yanglinensis]|uniref:Uncharacterized protein n=1 Tax=Actinacidiphila yanglinensis TaxID=310779 RepID=A0A1H6DKW1_9ACTN|nr:hypothetical protein [Actinacidiphila yanglinensis]SEG85346.1 hypothetical protein SAMN05216223_11644 [Actinacidiphila yanglinensis]